MTSWWRDTLNSEGLSQGDVIQEIPFGISLNPPLSLTKTTGKGGAELWKQGVSAVAGTKNFLFYGNTFHALVLSHSCDLDKHERKGRAIVAPIRPIDCLNSDDRTTVLCQSRRSLMPLPDIPTLGSYYADLRLISSVDRKMIEDGRIASMSELGVQRLHAQLAVFFLRLDLTAAIPK